MAQQFGMPPPYKSPRQAQSALRLEATRILRAYDTSLFAYRLAAASIASDLRSGRRKRDEPVAVDGSPTLQRLANSPVELRDRLRDQLPPYIRQVLFIRLISALEVFLVQSVRDVLLAHPELLAKQEQLPLTYSDLARTGSLSELLGKVVSEECRRLQSQGFPGVRKYYKTRLNIDFAAGPVPPSELEEWHDRRNLLVHRLGRPDAFYMHKYGTPRTTTTIGEEYFSSCISQTLHFSQFVDRAITGIVAQARSSAAPPSADCSSVSVKVRGRAPDLLSPSFTFAVDDEVASLSDILATTTVSGDETDLVLVGRRDSVRQYVQLLKRRAKSGGIEIVAKRTLRPERLTGLTDEQIEEIRRALPAGSVPKDIHKKIAADLGLPNWKVYQTIASFTSEDGGPARGD